MGLRQKLEREYLKGVNDGQGAAQLEIEIRGYVRGCHDTWDIVEGIMKKTPGIGPKTQEKIVSAIRAFAENEAKKGGLN